MNEGSDKAGESSSDIDHISKNLPVVQADEIDLVGLWVTLWAYRKLFLISMMMITVTGVLCLEFIQKYKPTVTVTSIIKLESKKVEGKWVAVDAPAVLIKQITYTLLPRFSSLSSFSPVKSLIRKTRIKFINKNNMLEIVNKVPLEVATDVASFHEQLVDEILLELKRTSGLAVYQVRDSLLSVKSRIVMLKRSKVALELGLEGGEGIQDLSIPPSPEENLLIRDNLQLEIDILEERARHLELTLSHKRSQAVVRAKILGTLEDSNKGFAVFLILTISLFLSFLVIRLAIFAREVKERTATQG